MNWITWLPGKHHEENIRIPVSVTGPVVGCLCETVYEYEGREGICITE